uniref:Family with sequence similarity 221 member B n=1 Tax=Gopherus evgoodei TaxID=1825980 RepID=A0A8C4WUK0_9SAUR
GSPRPGDTEPAPLRSRHSAREGRLPAVLPGVRAVPHQRPLELQGPPGRLPLPTHPAHLCPGYSVRPVVPARRAELVAVAKAMHRERFGPEVQELFHLEREAALQAMQTGRPRGCWGYLWDCFCVGDLSKCFCGHLLREHQTRARVPCTVPSCKCQSFIFIPSRPEDVGEFWLRKRVGFDPSTWRATCRCKHSHEEHALTPALPCTGCWCVSFESNFLCAACDRRWEEHETFFETAETRRKGGRPYGTRSAGVHIPLRH